MLKSNLSRLFFFLIHLKILSGFTAISSTRSSAAPGKRLHNNLPLGNTDMLNAKWKVFCIYYSLNRVCFAFCHLSCQEQEQLPVMKSGPQVLIGSFYELVQGELVLLAVQRNHRLSPALVEFAWLWIKGVLLDFIGFNGFFFYQKLHSAPLYKPELQAESSSAIWIMMWPILWRWPTYHQEGQGCCSTVTGCCNVLDIYIIYTVSINLVHYVAIVHNNILEFFNPPNQSGQLLMFQCGLGPRLQNMTSNNLPVCIKLIQWFSNYLWG